MMRHYLVLAVVVSLGCASGDRKPDGPSTRPATSPQAAVPAQVPIGDGAAGTSKHTPQPATAPTEKAATLEDKTGFTITNFKGRINGTKETKETSVVLLPGGAPPAKSASTQTSPVVARARELASHKIGYAEKDDDGTIIVAEGSFEFINGKSSIWSPGAVHTIGDTLRIGGYTFASDEADPLVFQVSSEKGYVFVKGRGIVTNASGESVTLPRADTRTTRPSAAASTQPTTRPTAHTVAFVPICVEGNSDREKQGMVAMAKELAAAFEKDSALGVIKYEDVAEAASSAKVERFVMATSDDLKALAKNVPPTCDTLIYFGPCRENDESIQLNIAKVSNVTGAGRFWAGEEILHSSIVKVAISKEDVRSIRDSVSNWWKQ